MYIAKLQNDDNGTILVTFPDIPEAATFGYTRQEALFHAQDALESALEIYEERGEELPVAKYHSKFPVAPRVLIAAKIELRNAMRNTHTTKYALVKKLKVHPPQVDRLLSLNHKSRLNDVEKALFAVGRRMAVSFSASRV